jgi:hypothetical protein
MEQWVERARTEFVTVAAKFFYEPKPEYRSLRGVVQDVKAYQTAIKVLLSTVLRRSWLSFPHFVIEIRYMVNSDACQLAVVAKFQATQEPRATC